MLNSTIWLQTFLAEKRIQPDSVLTRPLLALLEKYHMIPSMSRPTNPYDNASCESFIKTLKREEIYAKRRIQPT